MTAITSYLTVTMRSSAVAPINGLVGKFHVSESGLSMEKMDLFCGPSLSTGSASDFGYGAEEPPAFSPRTHASMFFQSGSSLVLNCLPP